MDEILVFIHIKKTAGISLQWLLAKQFGKKFFGGHIHTALKTVAAKNPIKKSGLDKLPNGSCVCKHWTYDDFTAIQGRSKFLTIVRDPVDRIVSHYKFYRQHYPRGQSFREYIEDSKNINLYSKFLPNDLNLLTEVLFFENLQESVNRSSLIATASLPFKNKTIFRFKPLDEDISLFKQLNSKDLEFYEKLGSRKLI